MGVNITKLIQNSNEFLARVAHMWPVMAMCTAHCYGHSGQVTAGLKHLGADSGLWNILSCCVFITQS